MYLYQKRTIHYMLHYRYLYSKFGLKKKNNNKLPSTQRKSDTEWIENEQATQIAIESAQIISELQESVTTLLPLQEQDHPLLVCMSNVKHQVIF